MLAEKVNFAGPKTAPGGKDATCRIKGWRFGIY
jgi:hypothetical protein